MNTRHILRLIKKFFPEVHDDPYMNLKWFLSQPAQQANLKHLFTALNMMSYYANELEKKPNKEMQAKFDALKFFVGEWLG